MCKAKKPKTIKIPDPVYMRNPILDGGQRQDAAALGRAGRSSLRIPMGSGLGIRSAGGTVNRGGDTGLTYDPVPVEPAPRRGNAARVAAQSLGSVMTSRRR